MGKHIWRCEKAFTAVPRDGKETAEMGKRLNIRQIMKTLFSTYLKPLFLLEIYRLITEHLWRSFLTLSTYLKYAMKAVREKATVQDCHFLYPHCSVSVMRFYRSTYGRAISLTAAEPPADRIVMNPSESMLHEFFCIPASLLSPSEEVYFCHMSSAKGVGCPVISASQQSPIRATGYT